MAEQEGASRTEEPTQHKLAEARKKGDVARSQDLTSFASLAGAFAMLIIMGGFWSRSLVASLAPFIAHPDQIHVTGGGGAEIGWTAFRAAIGPILAIMLGAGLAGAAAAYFQQGGFMMAYDKLKPDFSKVSPLGGFKRLFGIDGLVQFLKSAIKIVATGFVAWWALSPYADQLVGLAAVDPRAMMQLALDLMKRLFYAILALLAVVALVDFIWQKIRFIERMKMTKEELKEEFRQSDGDPHVKAKQKQIRSERARRRMMQAVPGATVVVMNPTHYAVALRYAPEDGGAPECVAKGMDDLALKIRAVAEEAGVPIVEDAPLARALYAAVEIDEEIPTAHYEAVAKIISFVMNRGGEARPRARNL